MKRPLLIVIFGVLLLFVIASVVQGALTKSARETPAKVEQKARTPKATTQTEAKATEPSAPATRTKDTSPAPPVLNVRAPGGAPAAESAGQSENYQIDWQSVNASGGTAASANYNCNASAGQPTVGYASSANYEGGIGYWYGVSGGTVVCQCPYQGDYDTDGFLTALDLGALIDVLFAGRPEVTDPNCRTSRGDFDFDLFPTALDLGRLIDHLFAGGGPPCDPCNPIQSTCSQ